MSLTTSQRLRLLGPVIRQFPGLGYRSVAELRALVQAELGHPAALDRAVPYLFQHSRAVAPRMIYHVTAGNLSVSAWQSLLYGLILGSQNVIKVAQGSGGEIRKFVRALPTQLRRKVLLRERFSAEEMRRADAVVVYGRDETIGELRAQGRPDQIFLGYGHRLSFLWLRRLGPDLRALARACAYDVAVYDQAGCLSPHAIFLPPGQSATVFAGLLGRELQRWSELLPPVDRPLTAAVQIREARDLATVRGAAIWESEADMGWTIFLEKSRRFRLSSLHQIIHLYPVASLNELKRALKPVAKKISTVGVGSPVREEEARFFESLGVSRICPAGRMQHPAPGWHHDGRPNLADLVRWVDRE